MRLPRTTWLIGALVMASACSQGGTAGSGAAATEPTTTDATATATTTEPAPTTPPDTTMPTLQVFDPACVVEVRPGDSLGRIASSRADEIVTVATLQAENGLVGDLIVPNQLLDVCIDNGLDDITGDQRPERNAAVVAEETSASVLIQQAKLNELFVPLGLAEMPVDGVSGSVTRRGLCASRLALGFPVSRADMPPGGPEEQALMAATALAVPANVATDGRWILIDLTCQVMITGEGPDHIVNVFATSTGEPGFDTRLQEHSRAFRFDPALENGGWHESTEYPVPADNPLNGNMYKPLYFDSGQAIHGANNVPTSPRSKGCARLHPADQDRLLAWLGLDSLDGPTNSRDRIGVTVTIRGDYALG